MWLEKAEIDLNYHLRRVRVPRPSGRRELDEVIGEIASTPLDRSRPRWEMYFAEGMTDLPLRRDRQGCITRSRTVSRRPT
jgi:diacylglycerol O-acyltransferase / wax synthase